MRNYYSEKHLSSWIGISLTGHIILILLISWALSKQSFNKEIYIPDYKVNLVTLERPKPKKINTVKKAKKNARKNIQAKKTVPIKKRTKTTVKKAKPIKSVQPPIDVSAAIDKLRKKHAAEIETEEKADVLRREEARQPPAIPDIFHKKSAVAESKPQKINRSNMDGETQAYYDMLGEKIHNLWVLLDNSNFKGMVATVSILIAPSGELLDVYVEEKSGNGFYDHSVIRSVKKAAPFPPLPDGYENGIEIGFLFRDQEVR